MAYPSLNEIELQARSGSAVAVIVEGEDQGDDAWVYGDIWFGDRAREVRFFAQDGWRFVRDAVRELRLRLPGKPIFGLIDRDFTPDAHLEDLVPEGVFRSRCYSVENYLLDPHCWHSVFNLVMRTRGGLPAGWASVDEVEDRIRSSYERCLPCTAFNQVVHGTAREHPEYARAPPYIRNDGDGRVSQAADILCAWQTSVAHPVDLGAAYAQALTDLRAVPSSEWPALVDGKMVLHALIQEFRDITRVRTYPDADFVNLYLDKCPDPPPDAVELLERILNAAQAL